MKSFRHRSLGRRVVIAFVALTGLLLSALIAAPASADDPLPTISMTYPPLSTFNDGPVYGQQMTIFPGSWSPTPTTETYQWLLDGVPIDGATGPDYTPTLDDVGHVMSYSVTASADGYQSYTYTSSSMHVEQPFTADGPVIEGVAQVGVPLTGVVSNIQPTPTSVEYVWVAHGFNVENGPTATSYTPVAADIGTTVTFYVNPRTTLPNYTSLGLQAVSDIVLPATFEQTTPVRIMGNSMVGTTLTIQQGWYPSPEESDYQWMRDGVDVEGATGSTYSLSNDDAGHVISVSVTVGHSHLPSFTQVATMSSAVNKPFASIGAPSITGVAKLGSTLTAHPGASSPAKATYLYSFSENPDQFGLGVASNTYTPTQDWEVGKRVYVEVTATAPGYGPSVSVASLPTAPIVGQALRIKSVGISGHVGMNDPIWARVTLTTSSVGSPPYSYVWMEDGVPIPGATGVEFVPPMADYGHRISVTATLSDPDWGSGSATSPAYAVGEGDLTYAIPVIAGTPKVGSTLYDDPYIPWGPGNVHIYYYWYENWDGMSMKLLSTSPTYTPGPSLEGKEIQLWESASEKGFYPIGTGWTGSQPVLIGPGTITQNSAATMESIPAVGTAVAVNHGSVTPASGVSYRYQWFSAATSASTAVAIPGATSASYTPTAAMFGRFLSVRITASSAGYTTISYFSSGTFRVLSPESERVAHPPGTSHDVGGESPPRAGL